MDRRYDLSNQAKADLRDIWNYTIDRWGENQADKYYRGIIEAIKAIVDGKRAGQPFPARPSYLKLKQEHHLIFYIPTDESRIFVSRVLHEAMDLPSQLDEAKHPAP